MAGAALLAYDARVTGDPLLPPYLMNLNRYYVAPLFLWQGEKPIPAYDHDVMRRFYVDWRESERSVRQDVDAKNPLYGFWLWFHTFKIVGGAALACLLLLVFRRNRKTALLLVLLGGFFAGLSLQSVRLFHYLSPGLGLLTVAVVLGLRTLSAVRFRGWRPGRHLAVVLVLAAAIGLVRNTVLTLRPGERGYGIRRAEMVARLSAEEGKQLVFVTYGPRHDVHQEWVYNGADLEGSRILFVRSISPDANERLLALYPRTPGVAPLARRRGPPHPVSSSLNTPCRTLLYLHGLASSPKGRKRAILEQRFGPEGITVVAPDLNVPWFRELAFEEMVAEASEACSEARPDVVVGSSLGALVALAALRPLGPGGPPLVLIAPALAFGARWAEKLPETDFLEIFHHGEGQFLEIHRAFFEEMAGVTVDLEPPPVPVSVVMGTADESVPFAQVETRWKEWELSGRLAAGSRFHRIEGGDHGLIGHGDAIEAAVRERLGQDVFPTVR